MEALQRSAFLLRRVIFGLRDAADPDDQALDALVLAPEAAEILAPHHRRHLDDALVAEARGQKGRHFLGEFGGVVGRGRIRSEEHTSELQSLMRISYAVFCLKKKKIARINRQ